MASWNPLQQGYLPVTNTSLNNSSIHLDEETGPATPGHRRSLLFWISKITRDISRRTEYITLSTSTRKLIKGILQFTLFIFGAIGLATFRHYHAHPYVRVPTYSQYEISQAGYFRPLLRPLPSETSRPDLVHQSSHRATVFDTWTFPSSASLSTDSPDAYASITAPTISSFSSDDQHVLVLSPIRNAQHLLPTYFKHLENLAHPKENTSLGFLLSDEEDATGRMVLKWCEQQVAKGEYRQITLLRQDFGLLSPKGDARHADWVQAQRRSLMGRARTLLLTTTINSTHDWVFWLDVDVREMPRTIISDLLLLGRLPVADSNATMPENHGALLVQADVIVPNVMNRAWIIKVKGYDFNSWAETPESIEMKKTLDKDVILHEGDPNLPTYRSRLITQWVPPNVTTDPFLPDLSLLHLSGASVSESGSRNSISFKPSNLYDASSPAYIGRQMKLDAVGGVATLVRASVHRFGAVFPSWNVDHEVETEGFGGLAKMAGARIVGLPNYWVLHKN